MYPRRTWQGQIQALLADTELWQAAASASALSATGLQNIAAILCGSAEVVAEATHSWLELLVAQLLHLYPDMHPRAHLRMLLQRCLQAGSRQVDASVPLLPVVQELLEV